MSAPTHVFAYVDEQGILARFDYQQVNAPWSSIGGHSLEYLQKLYPSMQIMTVEDFTAADNAQYTTPPVEITHKEFTDALYVLPPGDSRSSEGAASFKWIERLNHDITWIFARVDGRYFKMTNRIDMKHGDIVAACRELIKEIAE